MSNSSLDSRAKQLEHELQRKLGCWVVVGWTKEPNGAVVYNVYYDERTRIDTKSVPATWYDGVVSLQPSLPPGAKRVWPDEIDLSDLIMLP